MIPQRCCEKADCRYLGWSVKMCSFSHVISGNKSAEHPATRSRSSPRRCFVRGDGDKSTFPRYISFEECAMVKEGVFVIGKKQQAEERMKGVRE